MPNHEERAEMSRRKFISATASVAAFAALPFTGDRVGSMFVDQTRGLAKAATFQRLSVTTPAGAAMLKSYEAGVDAMLRLPLSDSRNWYRHALVHIMDCPHRNWWFLPWHRGYLGWFEQNIRDLSGNANFALPYWDWTAEPSVPKEFFTGLLDPTNSAFLATYATFDAALRGPLNAKWASLSAAQIAQLKTRSLDTVDLLLTEVGRRHFPTGLRRGPTAASPSLSGFARSAVSLDIIDSALREAEFGRFGSGPSPSHARGGTSGTLENQPHDNVHGAVGGMMGAFLSPVDPIFFLHHANLDRLWTVWSARQKLLGRAVLPEGAQLTAWQREPFLFFSGVKEAPVAQTTAGDYATPELFSYDYAVGSGTGGPLLAPGAPPKIFAGALGTKSMILGQSAIANATLDAGMIDAAVMSDARPATADVTIQPQDGAQDERFLVFVNPPAEGATLTANDPSFVGAVQFFGGSHHPGEAGTFTLPLTPALRALQRAGRLRNSDPLRIEVVPDTEGAARRPLKAELKGVSVRSF